MRALASCLNTQPAGERLIKSVMRFPRGKQGTPLITWLITHGKLSTQFVPSPIGEEGHPMGLCQWLLLHQLLLERSCADGTPLSTRLRAWDQHLLMIIHRGEVGCPVGVSEQQPQPNCAHAVFHLGIALGL